MRYQMKDVEELTQEIAPELLDYYRETGVLIWKWHDRKWFTSDHIWKSWNTRRAGKVAVITTIRFVMIIVGTI